MSAMHTTARQDRPCSTPVSRSGCHSGTSRVWRAGPGSGCCIPHGIIACTRSFTVRTTSGIRPMPMNVDAPQGWRTWLRLARNPGFLAFGGAVLLVCAPVFPGLSRLIVLPALLLAPGYALLRLLGQAAGQRAISVAVPVSLVLAVCASLLLDASGIQLAPLVLGSLLGALT